MGTKPRTTLLDPRLRPRMRRGGSAIGDKLFGAPGGCRRSAPYMLSFDVAEELAREMGTDTETAHQTIMAFGRVAQRMLLRGQPVGIPHVGTLHLRQLLSRRVENLPNLTDHPSVTDDDGLIRHIRYVAFAIPHSLRPFFGDNAVYTGSYADHLAKAKKAMSKRKRRRSTP